MSDNQAPNFSYIRMWTVTHKSREASSFKRKATEPRLAGRLYFVRGKQICLVFKMVDAESKKRE